MNLQTIGAAIGSAKGKKIDLSPLRFTNTGDDVATISFEDVGNAGTTLQYRKSESGEFINWDFSAITLNAGEFCEIVGENAQLENEDGTGIGKFSMTGSSVSASGCIMSLLYGTNLTQDNIKIIPFDYAFSYGVNFDPPSDGGFSLFANCTSLVTAPALPATTLTESCYGYMFFGCTGLTAAPDLPATTLAQSCYSGMFSDCTNLTAAPDLPATTLAQECYVSMFDGCTGLITAPSLPATTLVQSCYLNMFHFCTGLTATPTLPATTLAESCYGYMFSGCTNLTAVTCLATDISASSCTISWLDGVAASGTFTKAAGMNDWTTGDDGIPSGWTTQDA